MTDQATRRATLHVAPDPARDRLCEPAPSPTYDARDLVGQGVQACVTLDDKTYWLRITRAGKLILTK